MSRILGFILAAAAAVLSSACAGDPSSSSSQPPDSQHVSTIPWDRPESWEGPGAMGSLMPGSGNSR